MRKGGQAPVIKRFSALLLAVLTLAAVTIPAFAAGAEYKITVNRTTNVVTVYERDADGEYYPSRAFVCSTGKPGDETPAGEFALTGYKAKWIHMVDGSYGQYCTQIKGNYLFHSACYTSADEAALITDEYNDLGRSVSLGCVRLQAADAKWIYDNCGWGVRVSIVDEETDPIAPEKYVDAIPEGFPENWDPTDPHKDNPWRQYEDFSDVRPGSRYYDSIHYCAGEGLLNGVGAGKFSPEGVVTGAMVAQALYNAAGKPAVAAEGTKWYSQAVRWMETAYPELMLDPEEPVRAGDITIFKRENDSSGAFMTRGELAELLMELHNG